jgi:hypothetical protein
MDEMSAKFKEMGKEIDVPVWGLGDF